MDLESAALRKVFGKVFARSFFLGIEKADDENLMDEFVIVGESERLTAIDADLGRVKGPSALDHGVCRISRQGRTAGGQDQEYRKHVFHDAPPRDLSGARLAAMV